MIKPFPHETIAPKEYFYGRDEEVTELKKHIQNSTNVLLFSKRRMGKSTLIKNVFRDVEKDTIAIYIDIYSIVTAKDFGHLLLKGISKAQKGDIATSIKKLASIFKRVRVEPTFDSNTGEMGIKPVVDGLSFEEMIEDSFNMLFNISKDKKVVIAIDEFQQIAEIKDIKIDAILRGYIQESYNISYVFLGSKRNLLSSLFEYKSPLFSMATPMALKPIKEDDIYNYAKKYINISKKSIEYIYEISKGETKLIQMILHKIYTNGIEDINNSAINDIVYEILNSKNEYYRALFETFSANQKKCFKLLTKYKTDLLSFDVLRVEEMSKSSMQSSLTQLYQKEFIDKEDDIYYVPDRSFELWGEKLL